MKQRAKEIQGSRTTQWCWRSYRDQRPHTVVLNASADRALFPFSFFFFPFFFLLFFFFLFFFFLLFFDASHSISFFHEESCLLLAQPEGTAPCPVDITTRARGRSWGPLDLEATLVAQGQAPLLTRRRAALAGETVIITCVLELTFFL